MRSLRACSATTPSERRNTALNTACARRPSTLCSIPYFHGLYSGADGQNIAFYLTLAYSYPGLPILLLLLKWGQHVSLHVRIMIPLLVQVVIMALMPLIAPDSMWGPLALMFINGLCTMVLQSSLFGMGSMFPPLFNQGMMSGQGVAGVVASFSQIIAQVASSSSSTSSPRTTAIAYFSFAAVVMAASAGCYLLLLRMPFARAHLEAHAHAINASDDADGSDVDGLEEGAGSEADSKPLLSSGSGSSKSGATASADDDGDAVGIARSVSGKKKAVAIWPVFKKIWPNASALFLVFFVTFILFPGVMDQIAYKGDSPGNINFPALASNGWWSTIMLALFNVFDTIGRSLPAKVLCISDRWLLPAALARFGIIPLFLGCAQSWAPAFGDIAAVVFMMLFATSNGYVASLCFMSAPGRVPPKEREMVGFLLSLCLNMGIVLGSQAALGFKAGSG